MNCDKYFAVTDTSNKDNLFGKNGGLSKTGVCNQIAANTIEELGVERGADAIKSKIYDLTAKFKLLQIVVQILEKGFLPRTGRNYSGNL